MNQGFTNSFDGYETGRVDITVEIRYQNLGYVYVNKLVTIDSKDCEYQVIEFPPQETKYIMKGESYTLTLNDTDFLDYDS